MTVPKLKGRMRKDLYNSLSFKSICKYWAIICFMCFGSAHFENVIDDKIWEYQNVRPG